jgi:transcriptional regulator with XRE-family HTH domain
MSEVGENVKKYRKEKNLSQNALAKKAGIAQSALSAIESNVKNPSSVTVELLAHALGCTTAELLGEDPGEDAITPAERQLIRVYRSLNAQGREYIRQQLTIASALYSGDSADLPNVESK